MGGQGSGRKPDLTKRFLETKNPIAVNQGIASGGGEPLILPNHSGISKHPEAAQFASSSHTHVEADITDLDHYTSTDFDTDFTSKLPIDISSQTNLEVDAPITLVGDTIGLDESSITITESQISDLNHYTSTDFDTDFTSELGATHTWTATQTVSSIYITSDLHIKADELLGFGNSAQGGTFDAQFTHDGTDLFLQIGGAGATFDNFVIQDANVDIEEDLTVGGELNGQMIGLPCNMTSGVHSTGNTYNYFSIGDVQMNANKGFVMPKSGSVVGLSVNYDVASISATPTATFRVMLEGSSVFAISSDETTGTDKHNYGNQARGTDTFSANQNLQVASFLTPGLGDAITFENCTAVLWVILD